MKKIIAFLLCLAMALGCAAGISEDAEAQIFGSLRVNGDFTLKGKLPEGYRVVPFERTEGTLISQILSDDETKPEMVISVGFDEIYSDVDRLNDLDDEALAALEKTFTDTDPYVNISYDETAYGTRLMIARTLSDYNDYLDIITIYKGYFLEFVMTPGPAAAEQKLTDEEIAGGIEFLSDFDFVSGIEEEKLVTAGKAFTADITGYDAEAKTIDVTIYTPCTYTEWDVVSLEVGKTFLLAAEDVEIVTLVYDGDDVIINDEYVLTKNSAGLYEAYSDYGATPLLQEADTRTLTVADDLEYDEGVDPETGEALDEIKVLGAADLFAALAATEEGGVGFDSQNVDLFFDGGDNLVIVIRFYAPWQ